MRGWIYGLGIGIGLILLALIFVPFLIPIPPLEGTLLPEQLADPDSRFLDVNNITIHYKIAGEGEPCFILLHGFGSSTFSWREVIVPLSRFGTVLAFDRPGFGLTERPIPGEWQGLSPYSPEYQVELTIGMMDKLGIEKAILVGNSAGGAIALMTAIKYPKCIEALVLVDPAIYTGGGAPRILRPVLNTPQMRRLGPLIARQFAKSGEELARSAWHDPTKITPEIWEGYLKPLRVKDWDVGLWEIVRASHPLELEKYLKEIQVPVLIITGDNDRIVPTEHSIRLASEIPGARLFIVPNCGHVPHEECPEIFLRAIEEFIRSLYKPLSFYPIVPC